MAAAGGRGMVGDGEHVPAPTTASAADGAGLIGAGEPEPTGACSSSGEIKSVEEDSSRASAAPTASAADGREMLCVVELLHRDVPQGPAGPVVEPGARGSSGDIKSEEEHSRRVLADEGQPQAHGHLDVESGGGPSRSVDTRANNWFTLLCVSAHPKCARWVYAAIIAGGIVFAMFSRHTELSGFSSDTNGFNEKRYLLGAESALRVSLLFFGFFFVMFCTTAFTKKVHAYRNFWNSNLCWALLLKIGLMVGCMSLVQIAPSPLLQFYGNAARGGAWLYLAIQLISVTRLIMWLNTLHQSNPERWRWLVQAGALLSNFGSFGLILWLMHEHRSDTVDFTIAGITLMVIVVMICVHLKSEVTAGWLAPGLMISYVVLMSWTVIKSEPHRDIKKAKDPKGPDWLTIVSLLFVAYSIYSTAVDHDWLQFNEEVPSDDDLPYGFGYFHLVFALGSMYFGMVIDGWNAHQTMQRWTIDHGWWSAVVRAVNGLLAAVLYIWMLRTPFIWNKTKMVLTRGASWVPKVTFL